MSVQDNTERVLRNLHVLFSRSSEYAPDPTKVIVDKRQMIDLLTELNRCIYDMMEKYELTRESRDEAERAFQKQGDQIVMNASKKAEDVYAASVMYTDNVLNNIQDIMKEAEDSVQRIYEDMQAQIREQERQVRANQMELKSQLQDLIDTQKYLKLIEERNKEIAREKAGKEEKVIENRRDKLGRMPKPSIYANRQTEVKVNQEMLDQLGIRPDSEVEVPDVIEGLDMIEMEQGKQEEEFRKPSIQVRVDKNSSYFQWKEKQNAAKSEPEEEDALEEIDLEKELALDIDKEMIKQETERKKAEAARLEEERRKAEAEAKEQERKKAEAARLEEERRKAEAEARELERKRAEAARLEEQRKKAEAARLEEERRQAEAEARELERKRAEAARLEEARRRAEAEAREREATRALSEEINRIWMDLESDEN